MAMIMLHSNEPFENRSHFWAEVRILVLVIYSVINDATLLTTV